MAESPTTLSTPTRPERDVLLATKLHMPRPRPGFVVRPRLLERLDQGIGRELVLVCTPAGFGKTTLLADWARGGQRPVAWLSLDEGDNDPVRFWRHAAAALDGVRPGVASGVAGLLQGLRSASFQAVAATLVNELAGGADEVVLVLDDYHLIQAPPVHESLGFLLEHLPASLRLVLASRADPPLPLARLRARGQLAELRERDLRFAPEEAAELLRKAVGSELPKAAVTALGNRTEGWVAGLQLAALSLGGRGDITEFVEGFSGSHRYVLDYLAEEVLDRQPEPLRAFLLETSVLGRLSGALCDAVTGRSDSQALLEQVERANLFLMPLDEVRRWWRYHHLFADLLRARLHQERPERVVELHRAAAAWSEGHGLVDDAIRHALAAADAVWAARLIERHFDDLLRRCEDATLHRWLQALPAEVVRSRPRLCLAQALWAWIGGHLEAVEPLVAEAERAYPAVAEEPYEPSVGRATSLVANVPGAIGTFRAGLACMQGDAERAMLVERLALSGEVDAVIPVLLQRSALEPQVALAVRDVAVRLRGEALGVGVYVCWVAPSAARPNADLLQEAGVPCFEWPERTARAIGHALRAGLARVTVRVPQPLPPVPPCREPLPPGWLDAEVAAGLLRHVGARTIESRVCSDPAEASRAAGELGFPAVVKVVHPDIVHKSEHGGVRTGLMSIEEVGEAAGALFALAPGASVLVQRQGAGIEMIVGGVHDQEFGPTVMVGLGGVLAEVLDDVAFALAPLAVDEARRLLRRLRCYPLLAGVRGGEPMDLGALARTVSAVGELLIQTPEIAEVDLNPVLVGAQGCEAVDWRVLVGDSSGHDERPPLISPSQSDETVRPVA